MVTSFKMSNTITNKSATFGQDITHDYLFKDGGIVWGTMQVQHNTYSHPGQIGETISSTEVGSRDLTIEGYCYYIPREYEVNGKDHRQVEQLVYDRIQAKKESISNIVNPNNDIRIDFGGYYLTGRPSDAVKFGNTAADNNMYFCKFLVYLLCANPMFIASDTVEKGLSTSVPMFHFPLVFPRNKPYIFGVMYKSSLVVVDNTGQTSIGCVITLTAIEVVKNPVIKNITTGETIKINKTLQSGERIVINTTDSKDRGIVGTYNGVSDNYFRYWDVSNDWMQIPVGVSMVGYSTEGDTVAAMNITVAVRMQKYSIGVM